MADEFADSIEYLKKAEKESAQLVENAIAERKKAVGRAKDKAHEIVDKAMKDADLLREELVSEVNRETDSKVQRIIEDAEKRAREIEETKLPKKSVSDMISRLFESYHD